MLDSEDFQTILVRLLWLFQVSDHFFFFFEFWILALYNVIRFLINHAVKNVSISSTATQELNVNTAAASENVEINEHQSKMDIDMPMLIPFGPVYLRGDGVNPVRPF